MDSLEKLDLSTPNGVKEFEEWYNNMIERISKEHPQYPDYGYDFIGGKLVSVKR